VPRLAAIICALSLCIPIEGLAIVQKAVLQKALDFKSLSIRSNVSVVLGGVAGLFMAFRGYGVWALVGQRLTEDFSALLLLWGIGHYRPGWRFSFPALRELLGFSTASFMSRLGTFVYQYSDSLIMGIFFGPLALGLFRLADRLVSLVHDGVTNALQVVAYPQFSRVQDNPQELKASVLACIRMSAIFTLPALACLAFSSRDIMATLGAKWLPAADTLKVLCVAGMTLTFTKFTGSLLNAQNRPRFVAALTWGFNAVAVLLLCGGAYFLKDVAVNQQILGIAGIRIVNVACIFAPVYVVILLRACGIRFRELLSHSASALVAAAAVALAVGLWGAIPWVSGLKPVFAMVLDGGVGVATASLTLLLVDAKVRLLVSELATRYLRRGRLADKLAGA
jgi:O-antigen/teichoic acid export membrane protein